MLRGIGRALARRRQEVLIVGGIAIAAIPVVLIVATGGSDPPLTVPTGASPVPAPSTERLGTPGGGANCVNDSVGLTPISDLGTDSYKGAEGGLYPGGSDEPPAAHRQAGERIAGRIEPLDSSGQPDPEGSYALLSIGSSIAQQEFRQFQALTADDPDLAPALKLVNGAQSGMVGELWADPQNEAWARLDALLGSAGVSPEQVAVAWLEIIDLHERSTWPDDAEQIQEETAEIARLLRERFPNLRLLYVSSVRYNGYVVRPTSPEPVVYESGFGVKWAIEDQIDGDPQLNFEPAEGPVAAPWMGWGPYLWADGSTPRSDQLSWGCDDLFRDGLHPSAQGATKAAEELLDFMTTDPTAHTWFTGG